MSIARSIALFRLNHISQHVPKYFRPYATASNTANMVDQSKWKFNHTMLRVKDPKKSIAFYELIGMKLIKEMPMKEMGFTNYFLAYDGATSASPGAHWTAREGVLELCHNYGTEDDPNYAYRKLLPSMLTVKDNGNKDPAKGFGHTCISVDNIQAACQRIEDAGYKFQKKLTDGRMRSIAFALDPDNYWVEIIGQKNVDETADVKETDTQSYRMNHSMIRVKDPEKSLSFYQDICGMTLLRTSEQKEAQFTLYFLGYPGDYVANEKDAANGVNPLAGKEGILELTWNYGTEKEDGAVYANGNDDASKGFGHICLSVDDLDGAIKHFDDKKVNYKKRLTDGKMKDVAFILDPDNYWIEIIQNQTIKKTAEW